MEHILFFSTSTDHSKSSPKQSPMLPRPIPPQPYISLTSEKSSKRTQSLEDIIASFHSQEISNKLGSPEMKQKKAPPNPPPRVPSTNGQQSLCSLNCSSPSSSSSLHTPFYPPTATDQRKSSKPKLAARTKFRHQESASTPLHGKVHSSNYQFERSISERNTSPSVTPTQDRKMMVGKVDCPPLLHAISAPNFDPQQLPKTYISVSSYTSQGSECLSFSKGDRCLLIQQSTDGWWLVNVGGREGWTPGEYWQEDSVSLQ